MSTQYFLVCDDCKEIVDGASRGAGGYSMPGVFGNSGEGLVPFIITHTGHNVRIIDEHEHGNLGMKGNENPYKYMNYIEWTAENTKELYWK